MLFSIEEYKIVRWTWFT